MIVGFPGETEAEFQQTLDFCQTVGFARLHVFPFSPREGTPAASMPEQVPESVKADRVKRLIALGDKLARQYHEDFLGQTVPVLLEERTREGQMLGYTPEYIQVRVQDGQSGQIAPVQLTAVTPEGMAGVVVESFQ